MRVPSSADPEVYHPLVRQKKAKAYVYMYICTYVCVYLYIYIYIRVLFSRVLLFWLLLKGNEKDKTLLWGPLKEYKCVSLLVYVESLVSPPMSLPNLLSVLI